jgi:hypothetical protein
LHRAGVGGIGRAGTAAAGAAGAAFVLQQGMAGQTRADQIAANPWATDAQKDEAIARSRPFGVGKAFGEAQDFFRGITGREARFQAAGQRQEIGMLRSSFQGQQASVRDSVGFAQQSQQIRADTFRGLSFQRPAGHDRGTVSGAKLFEEEAKLLPLIRQRQLAQKERLSAEKTAGAAATEEAKLAAQLKDMDKKLLGYRTKREGMNREGSASRRGDNLREDLADVYANEAPLAARREQLAGQLAGAQQRTAGAKQAAAQAGFKESQASVAVQRQEAATLRGREQTAAGQARNLAGMGVEGRMRSKFALQMVQQMGIAAAPADLQQEAAAAFPETIGKMQEQAGEGMLKEFQQAAPEEYRDTDIQGLRKAANAMDERATSKEEQGIAGVEAGMADALNGLADRLVQGLEAAFMAALASLQQRMQQDGYTRNAQ